MNEEARAYHALALETQANYSTLLKLKKNHRSWQEALHSSKTRVDPKAQAVLERIGARLVLREDQEFPSLLREIPNAPFGIYVRGTLPDGAVPWIAIVGTRKATAEGKRIAHDFASFFAGEGLVIVSGLALGIDLKAHEGALEGSGMTVAVLGCGIDRVYPSSNHRFAEGILAEGGAIVSEYPPGTPSEPYRFLERNRVVSGVSRGVLVVEAPERSGALATARFANEQNRDVFVVPGPVREPNYLGSHLLIRQGATLVATPHEVLSDLGIPILPPKLKKHSAPQKLVLGKEDDIILRVMKNAGRPLTGDEIIEESGLEAAAVHRSLGVLSLCGATKESAGRFSL